MSKNSLRNRVLEDAHQKEIEFSLSNIRQFGDRKQDSAGQSINLTPFPVKIPPMAIFRDVAYRFEVENLRS